VELIARELGLDMVTVPGRPRQPRAPRVDPRRSGRRPRARHPPGTPTFFINGRALHGNRPLVEFVDVVEQELARAAGQPSGSEGATTPLVAGGKPTADAPYDASGQRRSLDGTTIYRVGLGLPGHQVGPDDALVTIVAWSDFQCPFCARMAPVLVHLREKYGNDVRHHLPPTPAMSFHRNAALAAEAAVAAAEQGKFWAFHDQVFGDFGHLERADLERFAAAAGLDVARFRTALDDHRYPRRGARRDRCGRGARCRRHADHVPQRHAVAARATPRPWSAWSRPTWRARPAC